VYAVEEQNGHLDLLVINKAPSTDLTEQINIAGFTPSGQAVVWQYGKAQDTAQSQTTDGQSSLANSTQALALTGSGFSYLFSQYSMPVLDLAPAASAGLPPGWSDDDVGGPAEAGSAADNAGTWTVSGGGTDIWNMSDQFNFAHESLAGDGSIVAQVTSLTNT